MNPRPKDLVNLFLDQVIESGHLVLTPTEPATRDDRDDIHALYGAWCRQTLRKPLTRRQFGSTLPWTRAGLGFMLRGFKGRQ